MEFDEYATKQIHKTLFRIGSEIASEAKDLAPYRTGNLARDIQVFDDALKAGQIVVGNSKMAHYAKFVHQGTKAHKIKPKRKKALKTPYGVFKEVNHPGIEANPYLTDAMENYLSSGAVDRALDDMGHSVVNEFGKQLKSSLGNVTIK
jgi:hypothetical protein